MEEEVEVEDVEEEVEVEAVWEVDVAEVWDVVAWVDVAEVEAEAVWDVEAEEEVDVLDTRGDGQNKEVNIGEDTVIATAAEVTDMPMGILGGGMILTIIMIYQSSILQETLAKEIV